MIRALTVAVALSGCPAAIAQTSITDATGRTITLPQRVQRVYVAGPPAAVLLLAVAPQKLMGWTRAPLPDEAAYLPDAVASLPALGRLTGRGNTANVEVVMGAAPDLIVDVGSTSATFVSLAQRVEQQTGIPYLLFDGSLRDTPRLLREIGKAVGATEAAESLARDAESQLHDVEVRVARIDIRDRPRVYFARGPNGLTTAPRGSMQAEALGLAGGINVIAPPPAFTGNLVNVSIEDVLLAAPDVSSRAILRSRQRCAHRRRGATFRRFVRGASTCRPTYRSAGSTRRPRSTGCLGYSGSCASCIPACFPNRSVHA